MLGIVGSASIRDVWTIDPDAAAYVTLARNMASGDGYSLDAVPHGKYPPGLPTLLAGVISVAGPEAYRAFHLVLVAALLIAIVGTFRLARSLGLEGLLALALALTLGLSETLAELSLRYLRTEVLFLALSVWAALALGKALSTSGRWTHAAVAALLIVAAMATRLAGVTLLAIPALHLLRPVAGSGGRRRAALILIVAGLALLAWMARGQQIRADHPTAPDYSAELVAAAPRDLTKTVPLDMPHLDAAGFAQRVAGNLDVFARASAVLLTNVDRAGGQLAVGALAVGLLLAGLLRMARGGAATDDDSASSSNRDGACYVLATLGLYLVWPFNQQERFYVPLLPWLLVAAGHGFVLAWRLVARIGSAPIGRLAVTLALAAMTAALATRSSRFPTVLGRWSTGYAGLLVACAFGTVAIGFILHRRRGLPSLVPAVALAAPLLFAPSWGNFVLRLWPAQQAEFSARRVAEPVSGPLARIDVNPVLEQLALHIATTTPDDTVLMIDVPKIMAVIAERRCVPFTYRTDPPEVVVGDADLVFYTRELPEVAALMDTCADDFDLALELRPIDIGDGNVLKPKLYSVRD